jgi:hypothetical protein
MTFMCPMMEKRCDHVAQMPQIRFVNPFLPYLLCIGDGFPVDLLNARQDLQTDLEIHQSSSYYCGQLSINRSQN